MLGFEAQDSNCTVVPTYQRCRATSYDVISSPVAGLARPRTGRGWMGRPGGADERARRHRQHHPRARRFHRASRIGASLRRLPGDVPVAVAAGTACIAATRRPDQRRQAVHLRAVRPALSLSIRLCQTSRAEPSRAAAS